MAARVPEVTGRRGMTPPVAPVDVGVDEKSEIEVRAGDVIEFTLHGERRTAETMLITDDGLVLLDLFDGDRPAWARLSRIEDISVFRPEVVPAA